MSSSSRSMIIRNVRMAANRRAMSTFQPSEASVVLKNKIGDNGNMTQQQYQRQGKTHTFHLPEISWKGLGAATQNIHRRSMVTITQTKSSDSAPLFSADVVDDVSSDDPAPTYVVNEDTNLIVTESCLRQVERLLKQRESNEGHFLRVFVDAGGCSGFQYQFEVDNELDEEEDIVVIMAKSDDTMKPRVVVDEASMGFLEGSTIDYVIEMIKSAFVVTDNPQSESACGCGSSFAMKNFEKFGAKD